MKINDIDFIKHVKKNQIWKYEGLYNNFICKIIQIGSEFITYMVIARKKGSYYAGQVGEWDVELLLNKSANWILVSDVDECTTGKLSSNGVVCSKCGTHNEYAEANQGDGTYICYNCR